MKVFFDTNVIVDILECREPFFKASYEVFGLLMADDIEGIIGAGAITDVYYIIRQSTKNKEQTLNSITDLLNVLTLVDTKAQDINTALSFNLPDFEDAVVAATALREEAEYIITRNTKDFANSPVPAITPASFLSKV
jgi:predicted nucleic acid-binding protein